MVDRTRLFRHILVVLLSSLLAGGRAFLLPQIIAPQTNVPHGARSEHWALFSTNNDENPTDPLLEKARRLRQEAAALRESLGPNRASNATASESTYANNVKELPGSTWRITYRFASQPEPKSSETNNNGASSILSRAFDSSKQQEDGQEPLLARVFYSGTMDLYLTADGYTQLRGHEPKTGRSAAFQIVKVWGWDEEVSKDDDNERYLLWSMDVQLPPTDTTLANQVIRFYFQARVDADASGVLRLREGTVTRKQDITENRPKRWGLFDVSGILTEFRYVGDFVAKSIRLSENS